MGYILIMWLHTYEGGVDIHSVRFNDLESCTYASEQFLERQKDKAKSFCTYSKPKEQSK